MNKDLLEDFVEIAVEKYGSLHKTTETDTVISYSWEIYPSDTYSRLRHRIRRKIDEIGWDMDQNEWYMLADLHHAVTRSYFTITYDKLKDKVSLSHFNTGYGYAYKRGRIYIIRDSTPILCFSKYIYAFQRCIVSKRKKWQPRIYTGYYYNETYSEFLQRAIGAGKELLQLYVSHRHMSASKDLSGIRGMGYAFYSRYGFTIYELMDILKLKGNLSDYNWIISTGGKKVTELCNVIAWRHKEGVSKGHDILWGSANFVHEMWRRDYGIDLPW